MTDSFIPQTTYQPPIHQSSAACWLRCQRCFLLRYRWGLQPKQPPAARAAHRGKLVHRLLELGPSRLADFQAEIQQQAEALNTRADREGDPLGLLEQAATQLLRDSAMACAVCQVFWDTFPAFNPDNPDSPLQTVCTEQTITATISPTSYTGAAQSLMPPITLEGRLDRLCQAADSANIWLMDYKTTSQDPQHVLTGYQFSLQCRLYRILADSYCQQHHLTEPKGFILNVIRMPTIVMCSKDKSFNDYLQRCRQWYREKGLEACAAYQIQYAEPLMPHELLRVLYCVHRATQQPPDPQLFPRDLTTSYCCSYRRVCPYYTLCSTDMSAWPALIEQSFVQQQPFLDDTAADSDDEETPF